MSTSRGLGRELEGARRDERIWRKKRTIPPWSGEGGPLIFSTVRLRPIREIPDLVEKERCNVDARFPGEFSRDTALDSTKFRRYGVDFHCLHWAKVEEMDTQLSRLVGGAWLKRWTSWTGRRSPPSTDSARYGGLPDDPWLWWLLWANVLLSSIVIAARLRNGWRKTLTCSEAFSSPHKIAWHCNTCRRIVGESLAAIVFFQLASTVVPGSVVVCPEILWLG